MAHNLQMNMGQIPQMNMGQNPQKTTTQIPQMMVNQQLIGTNHFPGNNQLQNSKTHFQPKKNDQPSLITNAYTQNPNRGQHFTPSHPYVDKQFANQPGQLAYELNRPLVRFPSCNVHYFLTI